ncbi:PIN domain-containing protein [Metallosphaera tengchongensis]|uniref:PIN domain-containing protein n=1 Tax=Metallosphaera tengchongensis TaxID=1532350 RepID=A0A6N0NSU1_9CREN|nr:PIN domain-containing protein [Metallosphaera tengchongensis]QKQ99805.1 PIN domain-containing protein [Metallosphaera tengchongensis]
MEISRMGSGGTLGVLVDTNVLIYVYDKADPFNNVIDFFDYKPNFYIHRLVLQELEILENKYKNSTKMQSRISLARKYLDTYKAWWIVIDSFSELPTDDALLKTAKEYNLFLFTNDELLRQRATKSHVRVIFLGKHGKLHITRE